MCKIFRLLTALLFATALLVACGGDGSSGPSSGPSLPRSPAQGSVTSKTTVLVYIIGSNLESDDGSASGNIKEMMAVGSTANMNVIIQTGGANRGVGSAAEIADNPARVIDWTKVQRYRVQKGNLLQILPDLGPDVKDTAVDMGSKATLQSFLEWGVKTYPADKYIVVLWDHGGGINGGIGEDQITKGTLTVPVIQESLQAVSQAQNPVIKFEMVGFDACLMATAEVAASLANSTKYMVASQDLEPGGGWAWDRFLRFVTDNPTATGKEIGAKIADTYLDKMNVDDATVTLSVTDLSKMAALSAATDGFATALQKYTAKTLENLNAWKQIAYARAKSLDWYTAPIMGQSTDLVDMAIFPANVVTNINKFVGADQPLMDASDVLYKALSAAVVYKVQNGSDLGASGLSIYFPSILAAYVDGNHEYASNTMSGGTATFASNYTNGSTGLVKTYYDFYDDNKDKLKALVTKDSTNDKHYAALIINDFAMVLSAHQANDCQINRDLSTPLVFEKVECFDAMQLNENSTYDTTTGQWGVDFTGTQNWVLIGDPAYTVAMIPDQVASVSSEIHNRSLVPAYYYYEKYKKWVQGVLLVEEYVPQGGSTTAFRVLGFQGGTPGSSSNPERFYRINDKDRFALGAYYFESTLLRYAFGRTNREVTVSGGTLNLKRGSIPSGGNFGYIVTDLTGNLSVPGTFDFVNYQN